MGTIPLPGDHAARPSSHPSHEVVSMVEVVHVAKFGDKNELSRGMRLKGVCARRGH